MKKTYYSDDDHDAKIQYLIKKLNLSNQSQVIDKAIDLIFETVQTDTYNESRKTLAMLLKLNNNDKLIFESVKMILKYVIATYRFNDQNNIKTKDVTDEYNNFIINLMEITGNKKNK